MDHHHKNSIITAICIATIITSFAIMSSWVFNVPALRETLNGFAAMKFNTALCFVFFASALLFSIKTRSKKIAFFFVLVLTGTFLGLITFLKYVFHFNSGLDELFVSDKAVFLPIYRDPDRMGIPSALNFVGLGAGFLMIKSENKFLNILSQCLFQFVIIVSIITLIDSLYGSFLYSNLFHVTSMSPLTVCIFLILSLAASFFKPSIGIAGLLIGNGIGNQMAKRLSVLILSMIIISGSLLSERQHLRLLSSQGIALSLFAVCYFLISLIIIWNTGNWLNRLNAERLKAEDDVKLMNAELERKVEERSAELTDLLKQFKQSEERYHSLFENASDAIYLLDGEGNFLEANERMCQMSGYSRSELMQFNITRLIDPDQLKTDPIIIGYLHPNSSAIRERQLIDKNGRLIIVEINAKRFAGENVLVIARNITARKQMDAELRASEQKYKLLFENNPVPLSMVAKDDMSIIAVNEATAALYGYNMDELSNMDVRKIRPPEGLQEQKESYQLTASEPINFGIVRHVKKDRTIIFVNIISQDITFEGRMVRLSSIMDVTDRILAEESLKKSEANLKTIMDATDVGYALLDKGLNVVAQNYAATNFANILFNKVPEKGDQIIDYFPADDFQQFKKYTEEVFKGISVSYEMSHHQADSSVLWHNIRMFPIIDNQGEIFGLLVALTDVTGHKNAEIRLEELNQTLKNHAKDLAVSNAELEQFAYVASHDLQEPLRMITSFMSLLDKKYGHLIDEKGKQYIHFATDGAKRMRQIILDLLDFSRVGRTEDDQEEVDFNAMVNEVLALNRRIIDETDARVVFENLPTVRTYKTSIRQVFQNLMGNSFKYRAEDRAPLINISCKETKTHYQFALKDNGIGISNEYFDKIFVLFQRLHNKDEYSGTGMGLAIAKKIVENLGGKIWVESEEGVGSTFYFTIPKNNKPVRK